MFPITLLVFTIGVAGWTVAGDEAGGQLELLLANPIGRIRVAVERATAMVVMLACLTTVSIAVLVLLAPATELADGLPTPRLVAAVTASALAALTFGALTFAIGAATGHRAVAVGVSTAIAVIGFVVQGLAEEVAPLRVVRELMPWNWLIEGDPLRSGFRSPRVHPAVGSQRGAVRRGRVAVPRTRPCLSTHDRRITGKSSEAWPPIGRKEEGDRDHSRR